MESYLAGSATLYYLPSRWGRTGLIALKIDYPALIQTIRKESETARQQLRAVGRIEKNYIETLTGAGEKL
jgi:hypothetical protein